MCKCMLLVTMTLPSLLLEVFVIMYLVLVTCMSMDLSFLKYIPRRCVGDVSIYILFFLKIFSKGCAILIKHPHK